MVAFAKFRCGFYDFNIYKGTFSKTDVLCTLCDYKVVENEYHVLLVCPLYIDLRKKYLPSKFYSCPSMHKFIIMLSSKNASFLSQLSHFVYYALIRRNDTTHSM